MGIRTMLISIPNGHRLFHKKASVDLTSFFTRISPISGFKVKHRCTSSRLKHLGDNSNKYYLMLPAPRRTPIASAEGNKDGLPEKSTGKVLQEGTILGAVSLIVGTSIGSGILALPQKTYTAKKLDKDFVVAKENIKYDNARGWSESNKLSILATSIAVFPSMLISTIVPDVFSAATDIAGGYCMTILYGVLPPAMAWAMRSRLFNEVHIDEDKEFEENHCPLTFSNAKPILLGVGIFSCGIVMEQMVQDLILFRP